MTTYVILVSGPNGFITAVGPEDEESAKTNAMLIEASNGDLSCEITLLTDTQSVLDYQAL